MPTNDCYIQFTEEEMIEAGCKPGDKFSVYHNDDGSILMEKFVSIEIDFGAIEEESRMALYEKLIAESCEKDTSINEVISDMLRSFVEDNEEYLDDETNESPSDSDNDFHSVYKSGEEFTIYVDKWGDETCFNKRGEIVATTSLNDGSESCSNPDCCKATPPESSDKIEEQEWGNGIAMLPMNMFQRIENILEYNESLRDKEGNPPEIGDLTFALRQDGVDVTVPQVEAILQLEEDTIVKKIAWRS